MAGLALTVEARLQELDNLQKKLKSLQEQARTFDSTNDPSGFSKLTKQITETEKAAARLKSSLMPAAQQMENLNKVASQMRETLSKSASGGDLTDVLITQRKAIADLTVQYDEYKKLFEEVRKGGDVSFGDAEKIAEAGRLFKEAKEEIELYKINQKELIESIGRDIKSLENQSKTLKPGAVKQELSYDIIEAKKALEEEKVVLSEVEKNLKKFSGAQKEAESTSKEFAKQEREKEKEIKKTEEAIKRQAEKQEEAAKRQEAALKKQQERESTYLYQMRQIRQEMFELTSGDGTVSSENLARYDELKQKLSEVGTAYRKVTQEQKLLTTEGSATLSGIISGVSGVAGAFSAAQGVMALFVKNNEELAAIQTKLQSAMAITIGLQQVSTTLSSTSAFRTQVVTKVTKGWTAAQTFLNKQLGLSVGLSKALVTGGIGLLIVGVGLLVKKLNEQSKAQEEANKKAEEAKKKQDDYNSSVSDSAVSVISSFRLMQSQWNNLANDINAKTKYITENKEEFKKLGIEVNSVSDAETVFVNQSDAVVKAFMLRAQAIAAQQLAIEAYKKSIQLQLAIDGNRQNPETKTIKDATGNTVEIDIVPKFNLSEQDIKNNALKNAIADVGEQIKDGIEDEASGYNDIYIDLMEQSAKVLEDAGIKLIKNGGLSLKKAEKDLAGELLKLRQDNEQTRINQIKEEGEKAREQIEFNYNKQIEEIKKKEKEWADAQKGGLTEEQNVAISTAYTYNEKERENALKAQAEKEAKDLKAIRDKENASRVEYLKKYGDYQQKRLAITEEYTEKIAQANEEGDFWAAAGFARELEQELADLDSDFVKSTDWWVMLFEDASNKSLKELNKLRDGVKAIAEYIKGDKNIELPFGIDPKELDSLNKEEIAKMLELTEKFNKEISGKSASQGYFNQIKDGIAQVKNGFQDLNNAVTDEEKSNALAAIGSGISSTSSAIKDMMGELKQFGNDLAVIFNSEKVGDFTNGLAEGLSGLMTVGDGIGKLLQGEIVGGLMGVASGVAGLLSNSRKVNAEHREAVRLLELQRDQMEHLYKLSQLRLELEGEVNKTIFGTDVYGNAKAAVNVYKQVADEMKGALEELNDVDVVTGSKKSGWGPWKKRKDVWEPLLDTYDDLIDAEGNFNKELAESILSTQKLSDEGKQALQQAIELADELENAFSEMKDYFSSIFGDLGDTMTDALVDAFRNGTDAAQTFADSVGKMLDQLAKDMIYSITIAPLAEAAQEKMLEVLKSDKSDEEKFAAWTDIVTNFADEVLGKQDEVNKLLQVLEDVAAEKGITLGDRESTTQSSTKAFSTEMTQDQAKELIGRFTAVQMTGEEIRLQNEEQLSILHMTNEQFSNLIVLNSRSLTITDEIRNIIVEQLLELREISGNTEAIIKPIQQMKDDLSRVRERVDIM